MVLLMVSLLQKPGKSICLEELTNCVIVVQGPEHPNPGKPFTARGFPRHCYLPDSEKGRKVQNPAFPVMPLFRIE